MSMYITKRLRQISKEKEPIACTRKNMPVFAKMAWFNRDYISDIDRKVDLGFVTTYK